MNVIFNKSKNVVNSNAAKFRDNFIQSVKSTTISEATFSTIHPPSAFIDFFQIDQKNTFNGTTTDLLRLTNDINYTVSPQQNNTINRSSLVNTLNSKVYMTITAGRGHASEEIGIAAIDINAPTLILCQFSDDFGYPATLTKINILLPSEICIPNSLILGKQKPKLLEHITKTFPNIPIRVIQRLHFHDNDGLNLINNICLSESNDIKLKITKKYYALSAASALIKYLEHTHKIKFESNSLNLEYENKYGSMMIDVETVHRLELLYSLSSTNEKKSSLFGILDNCSTAIGKRYLRAKILQPLCDISDIKSFQECISELIQNIKLISDFDNVLIKFRYVDTLLKLSFVTIEEDDNKMNEIMLNLILNCKNILQHIPELHDVLGQCNNRDLINFREKLPLSIYLYFIEEINSIVRMESDTIFGKNNYFQRIYAVKPNLHYFIDTSRKIYSDLIDELNDYVNKLSEEYKLPLQLMYTNNKGFHIQLKYTKNKLPNLPDNLKVTNKQKNKCSITSIKIDNYNYRINKVVSDIYQYSNDIIKKLLIKLRNNIHTIYVLVSLIANVDIIVSLAKISKCENYCCPTFADGIRIVDAIHPLIEHNTLKKQCVPNNVIASPEYSFYIITGPNMGGKTVYIKMIAVLQILAQIGCFVPAKSAQFRICDRLFSRIGFEDNIEQNASSFVVEIREMEYIFKNITPNSLVIIDELCRSTNAKEGVKLAWKFCEKLIQLKGALNDGKYFDETNKENSDFNNSKFCQITSPFVFLTTHFLDLTKLSDRYVNATNLHFNATEHYDKNGKLNLTYTHEIRAGVTSITGYGISLARQLNFPQSILTNAENIVKQLHLSSGKEKLPTEILNDTLISTTNLNATNLNNFFSRNSILEHNQRKEHRHQIVSSLNSTNKDLFEIKQHIYDVYANVIKVARDHRNDNSKLKSNLNSYLKDYLNAQTKEFLDTIKNLNCETLFTETANNINVNQSQLNDNNNNNNKNDSDITISDNNNNNINDTNLNNHSYHSILQRLNANPLKTTRFMSMCPPDSHQDELIQKQYKKNDIRNLPIDLDYISDKVLQNEMQGNDLKNDQNNNITTYQEIQNEPIGRNLINNSVELLTINNRNIRNNEISFCENSNDFNKSNQLSLTSKYMNECDRISNEICTPFSFNKSIPTCITKESTSITSQRSKRIFNERNSELSFSFLSNNNINTNNNINISNALTSTNEKETNNKNENDETNSIQEFTFNYDKNNSINNEPIGDSLFSKQNEYNGIINNEQYFNNDNIEQHSIKIDNVLRKPSPQDNHNNAAVTNISNSLSPNNTYGRNNKLKEFFSYGNNNNRNFKNVDSNNHVFIKPRHHYNHLNDTNLASSNSSMHTSNGIFNIRNGEKPQINDITSNKNNAFHRSKDLRDLSSIRNDDQHYANNTIYHNSYQRDFSTKYSVAAHNNNNDQVNTFSKMFDDDNDTDHYTTTMIESRPKQRNYLNNSNLLRYGNELNGISRFKNRDRYQVNNIASNTNSINNRSNDQHETSGIRNDVQHQVINNIKYENSNQNLLNISNSIGTSDRNTDDVINKLKKIFCDDNDTKNVNDNTLIETYSKSKSLGKNYVNDNNLRMKIINYKDNSRNNELSFHNNLKGNIIIESNDDLHSENGFDNTALISTGGGTMLNKISKNANYFMGENNRNSENTPSPISRRKIILQHRSKQTSLANSSVIPTCSSKMNNIDSRYNMKREKPSKPLQRSAIFETPEYTLSSSLIAPSHLQFTPILPTSSSSPKQRHHNLCNNKKYISNVTNVTETDDQSFHFESSNNVNKNLLKSKYLNSLTNTTIMPNLFQQQIRKQIRKCKLKQDFRIYNNRKLLTSTSAATTKAKLFKFKSNKEISSMKQICTTSVLLNRDATTTTTSRNSLKSKDNILHRNKYKHVSSSISCSFNRFQQNRKNYSDKYCSTNETMFMNQAKNYKITRIYKPNDNSNSISERTTDRFSNDQNSISYSPNYSFLSTYKPNTNSDTMFDNNNGSIIQDNNIESTELIQHLKIILPPTQFQ